MKPSAERVSHTTDWSSSRSAPNRASSCGSCGTPSSCGGLGVVRFCCSIWYTRGNMYLCLLLHFQRVLEEGSFMDVYEFLCYWLYFNVPACIQGLVQRFQFIFWMHLGEVGSWYIDVTKNTLLFFLEEDLVGFPYGVKLHILLQGSIINNRVDWHSYIIIKIIII
jgi:hypothetical protein